MMRKLIGLILAGVALVAGCNGAQKQSLQSPDDSQAKATPTQARAGADLRASLTDQKLCAEQAKKYFTEFTAGSHYFMSSYVSHFDPAINVCYVRIDLTRTSGSGDKFDPLSPGAAEHSTYVFDAFENRSFAAFVSRSDRKSLIEILRCDIEPLNEQERSCNSRAEFYQQIEDKFAVKQ